MAEQRLSLEEVQDIAELAKLDLSDDQLAMYTQQLSQILDYFQLLQEVDTSDVDATASVLPLRTVMRQDENPLALRPQEVVANAPDSDTNQFKVRAVLGDA